VGPQPDGQIPQGEQDALRGIGRWMQANSEAVYGTEESPWGDGSEWGRITRKGQRLYLLVWDWQNTPLLNIDIPTDQVTAVSLLASGAGLHFHGNESGIEIHLPDEAPSDYVSVVVIDFSGDLQVEQHWSKPEKHQKSDVWHFDKKQGKQVKGFRVTNPWIIGAYI